MKRILVLLIVGLLLAACSSSGPDNIFLSFTESGPDGTAPVRMLITERYLRIEDGDGSDGFILFDRASRRIHSVSHMARTTLVINVQPVTLTPPLPLVHRRESGPDKPPAISGKSVTHDRYFTNDQLCVELYAAKDFLPGATRALREYYEVLAGEQAVMQARMPAAFQSACDLADQVFQPTRVLARGFPVRQINSGGVTRQLVDFKTDVPIEPRFFEIPAEYKEITTAGMTGR